MGEGELCDDFEDFVVQGIEVETEMTVISILSLCFCLFLRLKILRNLLFSMQVIFVAFGLSDREEIRCQAQVAVSRKSPVGTSDEECFEQINTAARRRELLCAGKVC